jgi:hypothetical protein
MDESAATIDRAVAIVRDCLPASETEVNAVIGRDVQLLAHAVVRAGRKPAFRVVEVGHTRLVLEASQITLAKTAYGIAVRAVCQWGAASVSVVSERLRVVTPTALGAPFVEQLMKAIDSFEWLDQQGGWFWFRRLHSRVVDDVATVLRVVSRIPLLRLWQALVRARAWLVPPPPLVLGRICQQLPGVFLADGMVVAPREPVWSAPRLGRAEAQVVEIFRRAGRPLRVAEVRRMARDAGLTLPALGRTLRSSPLIELLPSRTFALLGAA